MLALYRSGRQVDALESYRDAQRALDEELGLEPGAQLQELQRSILNHDPSIEGPPPRAAVAVLRRRRRGGALVALGGGLLLAAALAVVVVETDSDRPAAISENAVGLIDPDTGELSGQFAVGRGPSAAAVGAGSVWVANAHDGTVSRVDADTRQVAQIEVGGDPSSLAFGGGSLWVTSAEGRGVVQIDPDTNRVLRTIPVGNAPRGIAVASGAVWVATAVDGMVTRIDLAGGSLKMIAVGVSPTAIAAGDGALWVASEATGSVVRIDSDSARIVNAINVGNGPAAITFGHGAVWVANRQDGTVSRIDPATDAVTAAIPVGDAPTAIGAGEGAVWVANGGDGTLARIDPDTRQVSETIEVGGSPSALAVAGGSVWTAVLASRETHRGGTLRLIWDPVGRGVPLRRPDRLQQRPELGARLARLRRPCHVQALDGAAGGHAHRPTSPPESHRRAPMAGRTSSSCAAASAFRTERSFGQRTSVTHSNAFCASTRGIHPRAYYTGILGARRCTARTCDLSRGIETDAKAGTITIHLTAPDGEFLHKLTLPLASVVPSDSPVRFASRKPLPGTGPYRIVRFDVRRGGRLVRNRYFRSWSRGRSAGRLRRRDRHRRRD